MRGGDAKMPCDYQLDWTAGPHPLLKKLNPKAFGEYLSVLMVVSQDSGSTKGIISERTGISVWNLAKLYRLLEDVGLLIVDNPREKDYRYKLEIGPAMDGVFPFLSLVAGGYPKEYVDGLTRASVDPTTGEVNASPADAVG